MDRHPALPAQIGLWEYLPEEETANGVTHGIGLALSIPAAAALLTTAGLYGDAWHFAGCSVYAATLVGVYAASTLSHLIQVPHLRRTFRILDQAFIYLLIAGTYTPFALVYLRTGWWWLLSGLVWGFALAGFLSKTVWRHRIDAITVWAYVLLGWLPYVAIGRVIQQQIPLEVVWWLLIGGVCYLAGIVFLKLDRKYRYFHAAWHVAVIAGSVCHYVAILFCALSVQA